MTRAKKTTSPLRALLALALFWIAFPSPLYAQCTAAGIVTSTADDFSAGTLRQAILDACTTASITFDLPGAGPHTIAVGSTLIIGKHLTITGPSTERVILDGGHSGGVTGVRLIDVNPGVIAELSGLTFANGRSNTSGAIVNQGDLTIRNSTFTGNVSGGHGGALWINGGTATIRNSTFSGNSAFGYGGAIFSNGTLDLRHVTVAGNTSGFEGGGVMSFTSVTIVNSIVAGNTSLDGTQFFNFGSSVEAFNITTGDPRLGPLQDNGGPTFTRLPLAGSPALDGADNTLAALASLTTDQRGFARVVDGPDGDTTQTVDIGAVEAHPSIEDIPATAILEDNTLTLTFGLGDESIGFDTITATSSNQLVVADGSIFITGSGATRTIQADPVLNAFGSATITVTLQKTEPVSGALQTATDTFLLTVAPVADQPQVTSATTFAEVPTSSGLVISRNPADGSEVTHFKIGGILNGTLFQHDGTTPIANNAVITAAQGGAGLVFNPTAGQAADGNFLVWATTDALGTVLSVLPATATITVNPHVTATSITAHNPNPSEEGQTIDVSFTVVSTTGGPTPTGFVTVSAGPGEECIEDVSVGSCALTLATPGVNRTLTATYSSNDAALWLDSVGTALHTVTACTFTTDVTSSADSGAGSLRQALIDTCTDGDIFFDMTSVVSPITLTSGELVLAKNVYITGPGATTLTIQRASATPFRLMRVAENVQVQISELSLANGDATTSVGGGGAIYNQGFLILGVMDFVGNTANSGGAIVNDSTTSTAVTLSFENTFRGNSAIGAGGAIANLGTSGFVDLYENTISGNTAGIDGGAIYTTGFMGIGQSTITNNRADGDGNGSGTGGGIWNDPASAQLFMVNSIVAGNVRSAVPVPVSDDIVAIEDQVAGSFSIIGADTNGTIFNDGTGAIGTPASPIDARLGPLANNGGTTLTHALRPGSPAIDAGDNTFAGVALGCGCPDQRGPGFERLRTAAGGDPLDPRVDMGAIEADPTVQDILDKTILENSSLSFSFGVGDALTAFDSIAVASSNQTLVPNANLDLSGSGATRTLAIAPAAHVSGTTTVTVTATKTIAGTVLSSSDSFLLTVGAINDVPTMNAIANPAPIAEDSGPQVVALSGISAGLNESQPLTLTATSSNPSLIPNPAISYASPGATGSLSYTPVANASGTAVITVTLSDNGGTVAGGIDTVVRTFTVVVTPVADAPIVTGASTVVNAQSTSGLVISRNAVDGPEVTHVKIVSVSNGSLFLSDGVTPVAPGTFLTVAQGGAGLRFTPLNNSVLSGAIAVQSSLSAGDAGLGGIPTVASIVIERLPITVTLASSANPAVVGQSITFTATVSPAHAGAIQFRDGTTPLGAPVALSEGVATLTIGDLTHGTHTITAEDGGSPLYFPGSASITQEIISGRTIATGAGAGEPRVRQFGAANGGTPTGRLASFLAYDASFTGGVRVAEADINGDGVSDIVTAPGPGAPPRVNVFDGATGASLRSFLAYDESFRGGVFVAAGDIDGDGRADIVTGMDAGAAPLVRAFSGASGAMLASFDALPSPFTGGVRVAVGDINGDGRGDIVVGMGPGGSSVRAYNGATTTLLRSFDAYPGFLGGVFVAAGDVNGDGIADIVTGAGEGGGPHVKVYDGRSGEAVSGYFAADPSFSGGVRVAVGDVNGDGYGEVISGMGPNGGGLVVVSDLRRGTTVTTFPAYGDGFAGGVFVATAAPDSQMVIDTPGPGSIVGGGFRLAGWAIQEVGAGGSGVDTVHVWAYPRGGAPTFLGAAVMGDARPDVAAVFGDRYANAGFHLDISSLGEGDYDLVAFAHNARSGDFTMVRSVSVHVPARELLLQVDLPTAGATVGPRFRVVGWSLETRGTPIEAIHVWAYPPSGVPFFLGAATLGGARPDVAAAFGPAYATAGYHLDVSGMAAGNYTVVVYAKALGAETFAAARAIPLTVAVTAPTRVFGNIDLPSAGPLTSGTFTIAGWALAQNAPASPGIDTMHVWALPVGGGAPRFLGVPDVVVDRPDIAGLFGAEFLRSGFGLRVSNLPSGTWDIVVFIWPSGGTGFTDVRVVRVTVP